MTMSVGQLIEPLSGRAWAPEDTGVRLRERCEQLSALGHTAADRVFIHYGNTLECFVDLLAI